MAMKWTRDGCSSGRGAALLLKRPPLTLGVASVRRGCAVIQAAHPHYGARLLICEETPKHFFAESEPRLNPFRNSTYLINRPGIVYGKACVTHFC